MLKGRNYNVGILIALAVLATACDKAQLLAPTQSTITLSAPTRVLPSNGTTPLTATVMEQAGTPVHNGTTVRFTTSLGLVDPVEVQTTNGLAITTFFAGPNSGIAEIRATSGAAKAEGDINLVKITIGAAAVNTVTVRASPGSIGPNGGTVELIANVVGENGQPLENVLVTFNTDQGSLESTTALTNANGEARTTLTVSQEASVSATAGIKTSTALKVTVRPGPIVTIACAVGASNCTNVQASVTTNTATVLFTVTRPSTSSTLRTAVLDFGDGSSENLGNLAGVPGGTGLSATVSHTYRGPSSSLPQTYTARVQATDINGESGSASTTVIITPRPTPTPISVKVTPETPGSATASGQRWEFTADVTGGGESGTGNATVERYDWDFGDGDTATTSAATTAHIYDTEATEQRRVVTVTIRTPDGRTATGRTEILVSKFP